jgi:L-malate glycosyltransferase
VLERARAAAGHIKQLDQVVPVLARHDAIGSHVLHCQSVLRELGLASQIYFQDAPSDAAALGAPLTRLGGPAEGRWLLYHHSTGSEVADLLTARTDPVVLWYHNVTPAELVGAWEPAIARELARGRAQLLTLRPRCLASIADSRFNAAELASLGYVDPAVIAPLIDLERLAPSRDDSIATDHDVRGVGARWLFVGRVAPHKAQEDIMKAFALYRESYDPAAHLTLVGSAMRGNYVLALEDFSRCLGIADAVDLTGPIDDASLSAVYRAADVFVCLSRHEGFCIPLLEAMYMGLPVVTVDAGALAETAGDGAVVLERRDPASVAAAVHVVLSDSALRERLRVAGRAQTQRFERGPARDSTRLGIEALLERPGTMVEGLG